MKHTVFQTLKKFDLINILIFSVLIFLVYFLSLKFVFPGYFDPLVPHHADYYRFITGSPNMGFLDIYRVPRPIGYLLGNFVSMLGLKMGIVTLIVTTLVTILLTIYCIKQITGRISFFIATIYLLNLFTNPGFYFYYTYDSFDVFAYPFFILTIILWYKYKNNLNYWKISLISLFVFLCFFSKETFFIAVILFFAIQFIFEKSLRKYSFSLIIISLIVASMSVVQSHLYNSQWVNFNPAADNPYFVSFNPKDIILSYLFYFQGIGNIYNLLIITFAILILILTKKYVKESVTFILLGLSVYIPYSLQPNHLLGYYYFLGVPLIYAVILFLNADVFSKFKVNIFNKLKFNKKHAFLLVVLILTALTVIKIDFNKNNEYPSSGWVLLQESINRNILNSFDTLKEELSSPGDKKVLILGLKQVPFHPFVHSKFIENYFKNEHIKWTIATYNHDSTVTNDKQYQFVDINEINPEYYNIVIIYNQNGELEKVVHNE